MCKPNVLHIFGMQSNGWLRKKNLKRLKGSKKKPTKNFEYELQNHFQNLENKNRV